MIVQDAVLIGIGGVIITGVSAILGGILGKRTSSVSDDQNALNDSFRLFMESQDQKYEDLKVEHIDCQSKLGLLQTIIMKLVRAMRENGIPLPLFSFQEKMLMLENKSFTDEDILIPRVPPSA